MRARLPGLIAAFLLSLPATVWADGLPTVPEPLVLSQSGVSLRGEWNKDGTRLLTTAGDGRCLITESPPEGQSLQEHCPDRVTQARHTVRVWDTDPSSATLGQVLLEFDPEGDGSPAAAWNPAETLVMAYRVSGALSVWDAETGAAQYRIDTGGRIIKALWSPDGEHLLTLSLITNDDGTERLHVDVWRGKAAVQEWVVPLAETIRQVFLAEWSDDSERVLVVTRQHSAHLWDVRSGGLLNELVLGGPGVAVHIPRLAWDASLDHIWLVDDHDNLIVRWSLRDGSRIAVHQDGPEGVRLSVDGQHIVHWSVQQIVVRDAETMAAEARWDNGGDPFLPMMNAFWSPLEREITIATIGILNWQFGTGDLQAFDCGDMTCGIPKWNPDRSHYAIGVYVANSGWFAGVRVYEQESDALQYDLSATVMAFASAQDGAGYDWSPDGYWLLVSPAFSESLLLWHIGDD
ncbi:MAG: WD40 repeat domain-containing protein [Anaerolineae bacterium]|nr:WD40 repeat domain-containing protein [Anaerolineae bacterium]